MVRCIYPRCPREASFGYLDKHLCAKHWQLLADADSPSAVEAAVLKAIRYERNETGEVKRCSISIS